MWKNRNDRYALSVILVHWLTVILLVLTYGAILLRGQALEGSALRATLKEWHFIFGFLVLPMVFLRIVLRIISGPAPAISPPIDIWLHRASRIYHAILVLFLIVVPILGWLKLSADAKPIPWDLPPLVPQDAEAAKQWKQIGRASCRERVKKAVGA